MRHKGKGLRNREAGAERRGRLCSGGFPLESVCLEPRGTGTGRSQGKEGLRNRAHHKDGWVWYRWYPKHHLFSHCIEDQILTSGSPSENWCYADESAIGECVALAEKCHAGTIHRLVILKRRIV